MLTQTPVIPALSSWKTPTVSPSPSIAYVAASPSGSRWRSKSGSLRRTAFSASSSTVRLRRPRKSIFRSPSSSRLGGVLRDDGIPVGGNGTYSLIGLSVMTTPAAWVEALRGSPSSARHSMSRRTCGSFSTRLRSSALSSARRRASYAAAGDQLGDLVHLRVGIPNARPTSRMAARPARVPKVMICATMVAAVFAVT